MNHLNIEPKIYGYLRVSTEKQNLQNNKSEILLLIDEKKIKGNIIWIEETVSGMKNYKNRELGKIQFKKDDIFITSELSRIGRTMMMIMSFISELSKIGVKMFFTKQDFQIDESIGSQVLVFAYSLCSQIERQLISQRTKNALKDKKDKGQILGRIAGKMILDDKYQEIEKLHNDGLKIKAIAKKYNCSPLTITKLLKKHNNPITQ